MKHLLILFLLLPLAAFSQDRLAYISKLNMEYRPAILETTKKHNIHFELDGGMILVQAEIDEEEHLFILDSGAPGLILNNFSKKGKKSKVSGIQGELNAYDVQVERFSWGGIDYSDINGISTDLSHLESLTNRKISGLIGYDLLKNYEVSVNYDQKNIEVERKTKSRTLESGSEKPLAIFPISFWNHLPVINVKIGDEVLRLGLDTGAEINIIDQPILKKIESSIIQKQSHKKIYGLGHTNTKSTRIMVDRTRVKCLGFRQMEYVVTDLSGLELDDEKKGIDGILGYPFLSSCHFSIDFENQVLKVWRK